MPLPLFLLVEDKDSDAQAFISLVRRIGLLNGVHPVGGMDEARRYLTACSPQSLPLVVFSADAVGDGESGELFAWIDDQDAPVGDIPTVQLHKPLDMYAVIDALKALKFPERARIDATTLTVRVELWPCGTVLSDS